MNTYTSTCPTCRVPSVLNQVSITTSGAPVYRCVRCGQDAVLHARPGISWWLPILQFGVSEACPTCGVVEQVAGAVDQNPNAPPPIREIAKGVAVGALAVGTVLLIVAAAKAIENAA